MIRKSYQDQIPKSRVNIRLDVDRGNGREKIELPLKMLVLGRFSGKKNRLALQQRSKYNVNKNNLAQVMREMDLSWEKPVTNHLDEAGNPLNVSLKFDSMRSFHPEEVLAQVPRLRELVGARNLLRDLGSNLLDNRPLRRCMESLLQDRNALEVFQEEMRKQIPIQSTDLNPMSGGTI